MRQTDAIIGSRIHFATPVVICMAVDFSENIRSAYTPWNWNLMLNYVCKIYSNIVDLDLDSDPNISTDLSHDIWHCL